MTTSTKVNSFTILKTKNQFILLCWKKKIMAYVHQLLDQPSQWQTSQQAGPCSVPKFTNTSIAVKHLLIKNKNINQSKSCLLIWHYVSYLFLLTLSMFTILFIQTTICSVFLFYIDIKQPWNNSVGAKLWCFDICIVNLFLFGIDTTPKILKLWASKWVLEYKLSHGDSTSSERLKACRKHAVTLCLSGILDLKPACSGTETS